MKFRIRPHGVICYWEFVPSAECRDDCKWKLVESFAIDCDGCPLTTPSTGGDGEPEWYRWTHNEVFLYQGQWLTEKELAARCTIDELEDRDELDSDYQSIPGRAVTLWTFSSGTTLLDITVGAEVLWLGRFFGEKLKALPNWYEFLENGYNMWAGTGNEAKKYMTFNEAQK